MKSIKHFLKLLIIIIVFTSCNSENVELPISNKCNLTKYGQEIVFGLDGRVDTLYHHELNYVNDKILVRSNFTEDLNSPSSGIGRWGQKSRDSVIYDQQNRVAKIYNINTYYFSEPKIESCSEFIYGNFDNLPSKIKETRYQLSSGSSYTVSEDIIYNNDNQIVQTSSKYSRSKTTIDILTNYSYYDSQNISKITRVAKRIRTSSGNIVNIDSTITTFKNYDNNINPFLNFPFIDFRGTSSSPNNFTSIKEIKYANGELRSSLSISSEFKYNDLGYPLFGIYSCQ